MSADSGTAFPNATEASRLPVATERKPRLAFFIATACGLGNIPIAPGTWGSLAGILFAVLPFWVVFVIYFGPLRAWRIFTHDDVWFSPGATRTGQLDEVLALQCLVAVAIAAIGVWSAGRASQYWGESDPQSVVIDEVSGQHLTLLIGCGLPIGRRVAEFSWTSLPVGLVTARSALNWKYLLLGFILFRVFDIWKPFPARQAESLPGGWGIMTDDWVAGIYAAIGLWIARVAGV
jgi:phosphatidylglycerophosphatase A